MMDGMKHYGAGVRQANAINAALDGFKRYGYGIVDKDGRTEEMQCGLSKESCEAVADYWNEIDISGRPYRVVELFYKEQS